MKGWIQAGHQTKHPFLRGAGQQKASKDVSKGFFFEKKKKKLLGICAWGAQPLRHNPP
jgi:hypothetical protein